MSTGLAVYPASQPLDRHPRLNECGIRHVLAEIEQWAEALTGRIPAQPSLASMKACQLPDATNDVPIGFVVFRMRDTLDLVIATKPGFSAIDWFQEANGCIDAHGDVGQNTKFG